MTATRHAERSRELRLIEQHRANLPPLGDYFQRVWEYRTFAIELAKGRQRATNSATLLGQLWQLINPLLLALVYYLVWGIIFKRGDITSSNAIATQSYLTYLIGGLFVYYYLQRSLSVGVTSITGEAGLLQNTSFPRLILPLSANVSSMLDFVPMMIVYYGFHLANGLPLHWTMLLIIPMVVLLTAMNFGMSLVLATLNVYFRDTAAFLPYILRIWLYLSPIIWLEDQAQAPIDTFMKLNPLFWFLRIWNEANNGVVSSPATWIYCLLLGVVSLAIGLFIFLRNESEFTVRL